MVSENIQQNLVPHQYEDEIRLIDMFKVLVNQKYIIAFVTVISVLVSVIYALTAPEVYKSDIYFTPPNKDNIQVLNIQIAKNNQNNQNNQNIQFIEEAQNITNYSTDDVFDEFIKNLNSRTVKIDFIIKEIIPLIGRSSPKEINPVSYLEIFEINIKDKKSLENSISLKWDNAEKSAELLSKYFEYVTKITISTLTNDVNHVLQKSILKLENLIQFKIELAKQKKIDEIVRLKEEIKKSSVISSRKNTDLNKIINDKKFSNIVYNSNMLSLLLSNTEELKAQLKILKSRESDDAFIPNLRSVQKELTLLREIKINPNLLTPITITQKAYVPQDRIAPNRRSIVIFGLGLGLMLGIFSAFITHFIKSIPKGK